MYKTFKRIIIAFVFIFSIVVLSGCNKNKKGDSIQSSSLIGSWDHSGYVYTFNEDKTGSYDANGTIMKFTYEDSGTQVTILYDGNTSSNEFAYKVEGNKLIIKDSFGSDVEYEKK